jgi:hypothetical protein
MPSAIELREMCSVDAFVDSEVTSAERGARYGETSYTVDVPPSMSLPVVKAKLEEAFPGCKITRRWFTRFYVITWS